MITSLLHSWTMENKQILMRADLNVPLAQSTIIDDYKLVAIKPTLDLILKRGGSIVLATHIGRPRGYDPALSTCILLPWFKKHGYTIAFHSDIYSPLPMLPQRTITLLENLRFYKEEKTHDRAFAQHLSSFGDFYVNDAFGVMHRHDTSVTLVPTFFAHDSRSIGLLVEKELAILTPIAQRPAQPFMVLLGGGKVADKIPSIQALLDKIHALALGPAMAFSVVQSLGGSVGKSLVDQESFGLCKRIIDDAQQKGVQILLPVDYYIALDAFENSMELKPIEAKHFPAHGVGITIGPETAHLFENEIKKAKTVFLNGLMGDIRRPETIRILRQLFLAMGACKGMSVVGGGDSVAAVRLLGLEDAIGFLSTGGGATLNYLSGQSLPGLQPFLA